MTAVGTVTVHDYVLELIELIDELAELTGDQQLHADTVRALADGVSLERALQVHATHAHDHPHYLDALEGSLDGWVDECRESTPLLEATHGWLLSRARLNTTALALAGVVTDREGESAMREAEVHLATAPGDPHLAEQELDLAQQKLHLARTRSEIVATHMARESVELNTDERIVDALSHAKVAIAAADLASASRRVTQHAFQLMFGLALSALGVGAAAQVAQQPLQAVLNSAAVAFVVLAVAGYLVTERGVRTLHDAAAHRWRRRAVRKRVGQLTATRIITRAVRAHAVLHTERMFHLLAQSEAARSDNGGRSDTSVPPRTRPGAPDQRPAERDLLEVLGLVLVWTAKLNVPGTLLKVIQSSQDPPPRA